MKSVAAIAAAALAIGASAAPADITYGPPKGGWESIDWTKINYPKGTGENLPAYPKGTGENLPPSAYLPKGVVGTPFAPFTSYFAVQATPDQVVNGTTKTGGLSGASATYLLGLNSRENVICYNITLTGFRGEFSSPARTATHIHESARGQSGPPRIAFENPRDIGNGVLRTIGCQQGPFTTGLMANGVDTGVGFTIAKIEANPAAFNADLHSTLALPGAVRGQLA